MSVGPTGNPPGPPTVTSCPRPVRYDGNMLPAEVMRAIRARAQAAIGSYEAARVELQRLIGQVADSSRRVLAWP